MSPIPAAPGPLLVMGAGSVGCYIGGLLQVAGAPTIFVGRPRMLDALRQNGLRLTDLDGNDRRIAASELWLYEQLPSDIRPALVLLCVKSGATAEAARQLGTHLPAGTPVLSLQNGVGNVETAMREAPALSLLAGMVPFNVAELAPGHLHRGTAGCLAMQRDPSLNAWLPLFRHAGLSPQVHDDLRPVQWGKLLLNLNNPVNALSGLPLRAELLQRKHRREFAAMIEEALSILNAAGIRPSPMTPLPWRLFVGALRLPTPLFRLIAARMLRLDARARSSMADDLALGRPTEIDALCGEIVRLAARMNLTAPINARMMERVLAKHPVAAATGPQRVPYGKPEIHSP